MPRKKTVETPPTEPELMPVAENDAQMSVNMKGSPAQVSKAMQKLSGETAGTPPPEKPDIVKALSDPYNYVLCTRTTPKTDEMGRVYQNYIEIPCPISRTDLERQVVNEYGGGNWNFAIVDEGRCKVTGFSVTLPGNPKNKFEDAPPGSSRFSGLGIPGLPPTGTEYPRSFPRIEPVADDLTAEAEEDDPEGLDKTMAKILKRRMQMAEMRRLERDEKEEGGVDKFSELIDTIRKSTDAQIKAMRDELRENKEARERDNADRQRKEEFKEMQERYEKTIASLETKNDKAIAELKDELRRANEKKTTGPSDLVEALKAMKSDDKLFTILQDVNKSAGENFKEAIKMITAKPDNTLGTLDSAMGVFSKMADTFGFAQGGDKEETLEGQILSTVKTVVPEITQLVRDERARGREMTQAAIEKEIEKGVDKTISQIVPEIKGQIMEAVNRKLGAPAPASPAKPALPPPQAQKPAAPAPPAQQAAPTQPEPPIDISAITNVQGEIQGRVNQALAILVREIQVKPTRGAWIDFIIDNLPQDMVKQLAAAKGPKAFFGIVQPYANQQLSEALFKLILADPAGQVWLKAQVVYFKQACEEEFGPATPPAVEPAAPEVQFNAPGTSEAGVVSASTAPAAPVVAGPLGGLPQSQPSQPVPAPVQNVGPGPLGGLPQAQAQKVEVTQTQKAETPPAAQ